MRESGRRVTAEYQLRRIYIRAPQDGDAAYLGMEIHVVDDKAAQYANLRPAQYHGSIYDVVACKKGHQKPVGEWNSETVIAKGKQIKVILNGETIVLARYMSTEYRTNGLDEMATTLERVCREGRRDLA